MIIKDKKVYINGEPVDDPLIIGNYVLQEATEAEQNEVNFRNDLRQLIRLQIEMAKLSYYMDDTKLDALWCKLPAMTYPFDINQRSTAQLIQLCEAYKSGLLIIKETE